MKFSRIAGAAGLGFVGVVGVANILLQRAGMPTADASPADITAFFTDHATATGLASAVAPAAWVLLSVFGAGAAQRIWRIESERGEAWSLVGLIGVAMQNALFAGVVALQLTLRAEPTADPAIWDLHNAIFAVNGTSLAVILAGLSIGGLRTGTLRTWHGRTGLVAAAAMLTSAISAPLTLEGGGGGIEYVGLGGFVLWLVWVITYGVDLLRDRSPALATRPAVAVPR